MIRRALGLTLVLLVATPLGGPAGARTAAAARDWTTVVGRTPAGAFVIGNPAAPVKLVEYLSYTCPHCAAFTAQSAPVLFGELVRSGSTNVEIRNAARDRFDLAAALLARCAGPAGFLGATEAIFTAQGDWIERGVRYAAISDARIAAWPELAQLRALALGSGLGDLMRGRGMSSAAIDTCFADQADLLRVATMSDQAAATIPGTPSFVLNGKPVANLGWAGLEPLLRAAGAR